jgi:hypothetical protein
MPLIAAGATLLGGIIGGNSAKKAAQTQANAQLEGARIAADAQRFRPVGVTTRFGSSNFQTDAQGNLIGAGYNVSPEVAMMRDRLLSQAGGQGFQTAEQAQAAQEQLFNLGQQYLAQSPQEAAQQWMQSQQALLAPSRERAAAGLTQNLFNTGRGGVAVAQGGGMGASNPELQALLNAQAAQDAQLAADAQAQGRAQTTFGAGLFGTGLELGSTAYNPLKTQFGLAQSLESSGQGALDLGAQLGGRAAQAGANVGSTLMTGSTNAANSMAAANSYSPFAAALQGAGSNPQFVSGARNLFGAGGTINQFMSPAGNPLQTGQYADPGYWT